MRLTETHREVLHAILCNDDDDDDGDDGDDVDDDEDHNGNQTVFYKVYFVIMSW